MSEDVSKIRIRTEKMFLKQVKDKLQDMQITLKEKSWNKKHLHSFTSHCFAIKGQAENMGFMLLADTVQSLHDFIKEYKPRGNRKHKLIVRKHLEVVALATEFQSVKDGGKRGRQIIDALHRLIVHEMEEGSA